MGRMMIFLLSLGLVCGLAFQAAPVAEAAGKDASGIQWSTLSALESNDLKDIAINKDQVYVAVGGDGTILRSMDGKQWTSSKSPTIGDLESLATNGSQFVAAGSDGSLLSSRDGAVWSVGRLMNPPAQRDFYRYYDATYPKLYTSVGWGQKVRLADLHFSHVIWDGKRYASVGTWKLAVKKDSPTIVVQAFTATSADGIQWSIAPLKYDANKLKKLNSGIYPSDPEKIAFNGSKYAVIAGQVTFTAPATGGVWEARIPAGNKGLRDLFIHNDSFIALGNNDAGANALYSSTDGLQWKVFKSDLSSNGEVDSIVWDGQQYLGLGEFGTTLRSATLETWQSSDNYVNYENSLAGFINQVIYKVIFDGKQHIAVAEDGLILTNEHFGENVEGAADWSLVRTKKPVDFTNLVYDGKGRYVATGSQYISFLVDKGSIWESSNGYDWTLTEMEDVPTFMFWSELASGNGTVIAYGYGMTTGGGTTDRSQYYYSPAPGVWEAKKFPSGVKTVFGISWVNQQFYAAVNGGYITSKDGVNWSNVTSSAITMEKIVQGGSTLLGLRAPNPQGENGGLLYSSPNTASWKKVNIDLNTKNNYWGPDDTLRDIVWNGKQFAVIGANSTVAVSANGVNWKVKQNDKRLSNLAWNGKLYVASAWGDGEDHGKMFYSYDGLNYTPSVQVTKRDLTTDVIWDGEKFIVAGEQGTMLIGKPAN
ncbi:hypothetical protein [Fontibacillus sp. BL9]|uniref:hypothetical protein n=1 Tax=Fontibacillus sp. BL9 TaxID=3389971 RepID=UPI00397C6404